MSARSSSVASAEWPSPAPSTPYPVRSSMVPTSRRTTGSSSTSNMVCVASIVFRSRRRHEPGIVPCVRVPGRQVPVKIVPYGTEPAVQDGEPLGHVHADPALADLDALQLIKNKLRAGHRAH